MRKKNIIQIGCNTGDDHVFNFVKTNTEHISEIILIDANNNCYEKIKELYSNISVKYEFLNFAIVVEDNLNEINLYKGAYEWCAHASLKKQHLIEHKHPLDKIFELKVPAKNINSFFEERGFSTVDYLFIDVEGMDLDIVNSIDFNKFKINYLQFEYSHSDGTHSNGGEKLTNFLNKVKDIYNITYSLGDCVLTRKDIVLK